MKLKHLAQMKFELQHFVTYRRPDYCIVKLSAFLYLIYIFAAYETANK